MAEKIDLNEPIRQFETSPSAPENKAQTQIRKDLCDRLLEKQEYTPHSLDNPKIEIRQTPNLGRSVFARELIKAGEPIAMFVGKIYSTEKISELPNDPPDFMRDHVIQVGNNEFLHGKNGLAELINHSCAPSCGIKGKSIVTAMRDIAPGEQLTWDYAMTEDSDWYHHGCLCGSEECRGTIGPYRELPDDVKKRNFSFTSEWLLDKYQPSQLKPKTFVGEIPGEMINKVVELFRYTFSNDWPQYVVCQPCDSSRPEGMRMKASEIYKTENQPVPVFAQDQRPIVPDCPCCQAPMTLYMDPQKTAKKLTKKLEKNAVLTVIEDEQSGEVRGFTFGREWSLKEAFTAEEWFHPYAYTAHPDPTYTRDFDKFLAAVKPAMTKTMAEAGVPLPDINTDTRVFLHNCTVTDSRIRGRGLMPKMMHEFQTSVPKNMHDLVVIGETDKGSRFEKILQANGSKSVEGFLHPSLVLMIAHHGTSINNFSRKK